MAAVSKLYGIGDAVFVWYKGSPTFNLSAQARTVKDVKVDESDNSATVMFTDGETIRDGEGAGERRVYTTLVLASTAIIDQLIIDSAQTVVDEGGAEITLVRTV